jgi:hypothetical protein
MTESQLRNLNLAEWNAREAIRRACCGEHKTASYHLMAARESFRIASVERSRAGMSADDIAYAVADIRDSLGLLQ